MNKEELLEEAKRRYPIGSIVVCLFGGDSSIVNSDVCDVSEDGDVWIDCGSINSMVYDFERNIWAKTRADKEYTKEDVVEFGDWLKEQHILICQTGNGHQWASSYMGGGYFTTTELFDLWVKSKENKNEQPNV